jgi:hypothetical protein
VPPTPREQLASRLMDEYKILQDKIDKIGAFRFTIKGWSITVILASIFAGAATNIVPRWLWAGVLTVFIGGFFWFEMVQTNLRGHLTRRVIAIEDVLSRILRNEAKAAADELVSSSFISLHYVPGIARHVQPKDKRSRWRKKRSFANWIHRCLEADILFYFIQILVVLAVVVFRSNAPSQTQGTSGIIINESQPISSSGTGGAQQLSRGKDAHDSENINQGANPAKNEKTKKGREKRPGN